MRLIGTHSSTDIEHFPQKRVSKLVLEKGGRFISRSKDIARNFGYDQYDVNGTRVDVFSMVFGSGCKNCNKCGEGIRFTRVVYDGDVKPCFSKTLGKLSNDSSDAEIQQSISKSINYLSDSLKDVHYIDSQYC
jgi:hypothetical protein